MLLNNDHFCHFTALIPKAAMLSIAVTVTQSLINLLSYPFCSLQRCCPHLLRPKGSGAMGPGALSSLLMLLLLLVATGDADMKGHFDPGEETESWVLEG